MGDEEDDASDLEEIKGPERLWRDGEHEPDEDPEELIDRVADEVEETPEDASARETRRKRKRNLLTDNTLCI